MLDAKQIAEIVRRQDQDQEVSPSTLHYYVQVGILPPAVGRGRSGYTPEHLTRFRLARRWKRRGAALAEVRERLQRMSSAEVASALAAAEAEGTPAEAATPLYRLAPAAPAVAGEARQPRLDEAATRYSLATEALRVRPRDDTPRTLRFRGGFSLRVPAYTSDEQIARLYTAIEAALEQARPASEDDEETTR